MSTVVCAVDGCLRDKRTNGLCHMHAERVRRTGQVGPAEPLLSRTEGTPEERFWVKVDAAGDCWDWVAAKTAYGYGQFWNGGVLVVAHRFSYETLVGSVPTHLELDHLCRNPSCVNPDHLEPVTHAENMNRGARTNQFKGRTHCKWGHAFDETNTYWYRGNRNCRACRRIRDRSRRKVKYEEWAGDVAVSGEGET